MILFSVQAARDIARLHNQILVTPERDERERLTSEQRELWDDLFPGQPLDAILEIAVKH